MTQEVCSTASRSFTMVYNDFLESDVLTPYEKLVYITLKKFCDKAMKAFPSLKTLSSLTGISLSSVRRSIANMKEKGILSIEHRYDKSGGQMSNLYTLHDDTDTWKSTESSTKEISENTPVNQDEQRTKKEPAPVTPTKALREASSKSTEEHGENHVFFCCNNTTKTSYCQENQGYSMEFLHEYFSCDAMIIDYPDYKEDILRILSLIHDVLNLRRKTIRIGSENKPADIVKSKFLKLNHMSIIYAIKKYEQQTQRIRNPIAYMLAILYSAPEQYALDIKNEFIHNLGKE